jgi:diadenosine tetraphosphatase ApaH/serine/threonine PP2A family protein phosphatase
MGVRDLFRFIRRGRSGPPRPPPCVPDDVVLYAVGDIHGRLDLLRRLLEKIGADARIAEVGRKILVFVGDYVDRGLDSRGVVETVSSPIPPFETVCLKGNHELMLLEFLNDPSLWEELRRFGGLETLASYGVDRRLLMAEGVAHDKIRDAFVAALPGGHYEFLRGLPCSYECGDYYFVHAGARPGVPLARQVEADQLWIREAFFSAGDAFGGRVIVHGHTPRSAPEIHPFRIGIDTGAYYSGHLTAARFLGSGVEFLQS